MGTHYKKTTQERVDIDANSAKVVGSNLVVAGVLVATTADTTTDATTLGVANGDTVIFIGPTNLVQAIVSANTFPSAPAVGDMLIHYKPV